MSLADRARAGVLQVDPADVPELRAFQATHFGAGSRQADEALCAWRFRKPRAGGGGPPLFWIARRDGAVVGQQGGLSTLVHVGGRTVQGCWAIDLMVDPAWRLRGVGPALSGAFVDGVPLALGLGVSEPACRALRRAGWMDLGPVPRLARLIQPLARGQAPLDTSWRASATVAAASRIAAPMLSVYDEVALRAMRAGTDVEWLPAVDPRMDEVWRGSAICYPVVLRRDLEWLRWRFDEAPHAGSYQRCLMTRRGAPVAYAVTRRRGVALVAVDFFGGPGDVAALFAHLILRARREGASLLTCLAASGSVRRALRRLGFVQKEGPRFMLHPKPALDTRMALPCTVDAWFLTEADSDVDHARAHPVPLPAPGHSDLGEPHWTQAGRPPC